MNKEGFIEKARKVHGDKYDYSEVEYLNARTKVCIICPIHGRFYQVPYSHYNGRGCRLCGRLTTGDKVRKLTREVCFQIASKYKSLKQFRTENEVVYATACKRGWNKDYVWLKRAQKPNGYWNNYDLCEEVALKCRNISDFQKRCGNAYYYSRINGWLAIFFPNSQKKIHWSKENSMFQAKKYKTKTEFREKCHGAYRYIYEHKLMNECTWFAKTKKDNSNLVQKYIDNCTEKYNGFYDYSQIDINNVNQVSRTKVPIICPEHGVFKQNLYQHLNCVCPCPMCRRGINTKKDNKNKIQTVIQDKIEYGIIYCYTNKNNGKKYIGQTIRKERRKLDHLRVTQKHKTLFDKKLQKEGEENFTFEILYTIKDKRSKIFEILNEKEKYYIKLYNTQVPNGYNISEGGGSVNWMVGYKPTQETLQKLRDSHKGKQNPMKGKHYSEEKKKERVSKWKETINKKYNNGYIAQRKNIVMLKRNDLGYEYVSTFPNAKEIERQFNIKYKRIHYVLKKHVPLDELYIFIHESEYNDELIKKISDKKSAMNINVVQAEHKKVQQIDKYGNVISTLTLAEARNKFGKHVSDVCNGKRNWCKGYKFQWAD